MPHDPIIPNAWVPLAIFSDTWSGIDSFYPDIFSKVGAIYNTIGSARLGLLMGLSSATRIISEFELKFWSINPLP
jgi:hypothetical protein